MQGSITDFLPDFISISSICRNITTVDLTCVSPQPTLSPSKAVLYARAFFTTCSYLENLQRLILPQDDNSFLDAMVLYGAEMPALRQIKELRLKGAHHNLSFLKYTTNLETLEISGEYISASPLQPLQRLSSLRKLVILNESEPLPEVDVIRLFASFNEESVNPAESNALRRIRSLTITSVWMHYQTLALLFRCCEDLEDFNVSIYLQSFDLLATDPFLTLPPRLENFVLNMPKTVGDNRALINFVWRRFLDAAEGHRRLKTVSMFGERLKTTWGRARECKLITQQSRYDERGRGLHPAVLFERVSTGKIDKSTLRDINISVRSRADWNELKKLLRLIPRIRTLSIIWQMDEKTAEALVPTKHKIATKIEKLIVEMTTLTKDIVNVVDSFVNADQLKIAGFMYEPPMTLPVDTNAATGKDVDELLQLPMMKVLKDCELELTRMCYYEPKKTELAFMEETMKNLITEGQEPIVINETLGTQEEEPVFDFSTWSNLSSLKLFYRSAIDPEELQAILQGGVNLKEVHLACVHDEATDLARTVALDLTHLKNHPKLRRIYLNYHHLSRDSMKRRHVDPLAACMERFDWNAWSPDLEEIVVAFVGLRGVQTDAVIANRNAAGKIVVRKDC